MKGFLKSKLVLALAAFVMLTSGIAVALAGNIVHSHAASPISLPFSNIQGTFYNNPNDSGSFDATASTSLVFTQGFPIINFNPPVNQQNCSNSTNVDESTRPFTDVSPNPDGTCTTIPAQDNNGNQAGVGNLSSFETAYIASITVPSAGQMTTNIFADDGWIFSIGKDSNGDQPTPVAGNPMTHPPQGNISPIKGYPEMGDNNVPSSPNTLTVGVNFPAAGTYPIELDYTECCLGELTLIASNSFTPTPTPSPSPTLSPSPSPSPSPTPRGKLFIFLQGVNSAINKGDTTTGFDQQATKDHPEGIAPFLRDHGYSSAQFMSYSYKGVDTQGQPKGYDCVDTFTHSLKEDIFSLDLEITDYLKNHPKTDIYLIGHSLGGVVAFGYLVFLRSFKFSLPDGGRLAGVITLDAPIGGVTDNSNYDNDVVAAENPGNGIGLCPNPLPYSFHSLDDLTDIFKSAQGSHPRGGEASLKQVVFLGKRLSNEQLANEAFNQGIPVLTIGNLRDYLWDTGACPHLPDVDFRDTQWLLDETPTHVYGRDIVAGDKQCRAGTFFNLLNHVEVLTNSNVEQGILEFLPTGSPPDKNKLMIAPKKP